MRPPPASRSAYWGVPPTGTPPADYAHPMPTFRAVDPRSGEAGPAFTEATRDDVHPAPAPAAAAFAAPALRDDGRRAELLGEIAGGLRGATEEIVAVCMAESGLPEV